MGAPGPPVDHTLAIQTLQKDVLALHSSLEHLHKKLGKVNLKVEFLEGEQGVLGSFQQSLGAQVEARLQALETRPPPSPRGAGTGAPESQSVPDFAPKIAQLFSELARLQFSLKEMVQQKTQPPPPPPEIEILQTKLAKQKANLVKVAQEVGNLGKKMASFGDDLSRWQEWGEENFRHVSELKKGSRVWRCVVLPERSLGLRSPQPPPPLPLQGVPPAWALRLPLHPRSRFCPAPRLSPRTTPTYSLK